MTREEALVYVRDIFFGPAENAVIDLILDTLDRSFPNALICDLIFNNPVELSPEQVVELALQREADHARKAGPG